MARPMTARTDPFDGLVDRIIPREPGPLAPSSASIVDPAAIATDVFNVDFALGSPETLLAQLASAVPLDDEEAPDATDTNCVCPAKRRSRPGVGPFAATLLAAQVLQENVLHLSEIEPIAAAAKTSCDHRTIVPLIRNNVDAIVKELSKPEPLAERVNAYLGALSGHEPGSAVAPSTDEIGGDLGVLRDRLGLKANLCSVRDEKTLSTFATVVQFTNMLVQSWEAAQNDDGNYVTTVVHALRRSLRNVVGAADHLRRKVPSTAWLASQIQTDPPVFAEDLYQWIHRWAGEEAPRDLKLGGRDGLRDVHRTMKSIKALAQKMVKTKKNGPQSPALAGKEVQEIVAELIGHMDDVIKITRKVK